MLRLLAKNKALFTSPARPIVQSIIHSRQNCFSNSQLEEGEYIEGDFELPTTSTTNKGQVDPVSFQKKYVDLDNFNNKLYRQAPRPNKETQQRINKSIETLKDKLKFDFAADDEFIQELNRRKEQTKEKKPAPEPSKVPTRNFEQAMKESIDKLYKAQSQKELEEKNIKSISIKARSPETQQFDPIRMYNKKIINQAIKDQDQTARTVQEYFKGEEGVDYIHPGESLSKTIYDVHQEVMAEVIESRRMKTPNREDREALEEWRIEKGVSEIEPVGGEEDPKIYPGSSKGLHPYDDPDFFVEWLFTNMPLEIRNFYQEVEEEGSESREQLEGMVSRYGGPEQMIVSDVPNSEVYFTDPQMNMLMDDTGDATLHSPLNNELTALSPFPDYMDQGYQEAQTTIEKWSMFRIYPIWGMWMKALKKTVNDINNGKTKGGEHLVPSLYRYYNLLPEFARNHPIVINAARCLEFSKHEMTLEQKEMALNLACEFTIPLTKFEEECYAEAVISHKRHYDSWEEKAILKLDDDKESRDNYLVSKDKKKSAVPLSLLDMNILERRPENANEIQTWHAVPRQDPHTPEEDPFPILPLDYYQNEDGFWDDYIKQKEQKSGTFPLLKKRPHFKH